LSQRYRTLSFRRLVRNPPGVGEAVRKAKCRANVTVPPNSGDEGGGEKVRSLWAELGLPEPPFLDEGRAPPIERELIRQMVRRELSEERSKAVGKLIVLFKSWSDAHLEILREETRRRHEKK
jgi:hypothetical protein